jgi:hypothetical protein
MELSAIDLAIIAKQAAGATIGRFGIEGEPDDDEGDNAWERAVAAQEQGDARAEGAAARWEERHGGLEGDLTDLVVLESVTGLTARLTERASLSSLVALRAEVLGRTD